MSRRAAYWVLGAILVTSLLVYVFPLTWDLPNPEGWAFDELTPSDVREETRAYLNGRRRWRYPPLHYLLLTGTQRGVDITVDLAGVELSPPATRLAYQVAGRSLSVAMALLIVYLVYRAGRQMFDRTTSVLAAASAAVVCPFFYYAKTANLEVPYLFWFTLAILCYLKVLKRHRLRDYVLLATAAALSVCTKDQAFALFVLAPLPLVASLRTARRDRGQSSGLVATILDRRMIAAALVTAAVFSLVHNLFFDWRGFATHVEAMRDISGRSHEFAADLAGHLGLVAQDLRNIVFNLGTPLALVAGVGVVSVLVQWRSRPHLVSLMIFPISYHLFFIAVARYSYDRFMLPVTLVLCFFAAPVLAWVVRRAPLPRWVGAGAVSALLLYTLAYSFSIDLAMHVDSRVLAKEWLAEHVQPGDRLLSVGPQRLVLQGHHRIDSGAFGNSGSAHLRQHDPRFLIVLPEHLGPRSYRELVMGRMNYRRVASLHREPVYSLLDFDGVRSNLETVNPRVEIYERQGPWGASAAEMHREMAALLEQPEPARRARLARTLASEPVPAREELAGEFLVGVGLRSLFTGREPLAAIVARNPSDQALEPVIRLSYRGWPAEGGAIVVIEDGEERTTLELDDELTKRHRLAPVAAGETRLYLLTLQSDGETPATGVRVEGPAMRPIGGTSLEAAGLTPDGWTTGAPAVLTWMNLTEGASRPVLRLACWAGERELPVTVTLSGLNGRQRIVLDRAGVQEISLWEVPALSDEVLILTTDRTWQEPGGNRRLGVQLLPPESGND